LPNTESSIVRIAENLSGLSELPPDRDLPAIEMPLVFALDNSAFARIGRLLAIAELVNHAEGWMRRSSKNAEFLMKADDFPDLVPNDELEAAIDEFDERVAANASYRWHPAVSDVNSTASGLPLLTVEMLKDGVGQTPMWRGRFADKPEPFEGEGRFVFRAYSLSDQSNSEQLRGSLQAMDSPEIAASFIVMSQALMLHATLYAENLGISVPRVGYLMVMESHLIDRIDAVLAMAVERTWPAMEGYVPRNSASVLSIVEGVADGAEMSAPGPVLRRWRNGSLLVDVYALTIGLFDWLRMAPSTGGARANATALEFELAVQAMIDQAGAAPTDLIQEFRGKTLRLGGESITDIDALIVAGQNLICLSCKKFELARSYDAGDYQSVRNAKTKVDAAVLEWADRMSVLNTNRIGDNYDLSMFDKIIGVVVTPELAFVDSISAVAVVELTTNIECRRYISFGELRMLVDKLTSP